MQTVQGFCVWRAERMRLTDKQENNLTGVAWIDYFRGYPNLCDYRAENNNWRKMHHLPLIRRSGKRK